MDCRLDCLNGGNGIGKSVRGELIFISGATVSDEEPSYGSGERDTGLIPIGLEGEEMGRGGYEGTGAWMDGCDDMFLEWERGGRDVRW